MVYRYKQKNFKTHIRELCSLLKTHCKNSVLHIPPHTGKGVVYSDSIDKSISHSIMKFVLKEDCVLRRIGNNQQGLIIYFNQIEVKDYFRIKTKKETLTDSSLKHRNNIFITTSNIDVEVTYPAGTKVKRVGIYLSPPMGNSSF